MGVFIFDIQQPPRPGRTYTKGILMRFKCLFKSLKGWLILDARDFPFSCLTLVEFGSSSER